MLVTAPTKWVIDKDFLFVYVANEQIKIFINKKNIVYFFPSKELSHDV